MIHKCQGHGEHNREKRLRDISDLRGTVEPHTSFEEDAQATAKKRKLLELLSTPPPPVVMLAKPKFADVGKAFRGGSGAAGSAPEAPGGGSSKDGVGAQDLRKGPSPLGSSVAGSSRITSDKSNGRLVDENVSRGVDDALRPQEVTRMPYTSRSPHFLPRKHDATFDHTDIAMLCSRIVATNGAADIGAHYDNT